MYTYARLYGVSAVLFSTRLFLCKYTCTRSDRCRQDHTQTGEHSRCNPLREEQKPSTPSTYAPPNSALSPHLSALFRSFSLALASLSELSRSSAFPLSGKTIERETQIMSLPSDVQKPTTRVTMTPPSTPVGRPASKQKSSPLRIRKFLERVREKPHRKSTSHTCSPTTWCRHARAEAHVIKA